MQVPDGVTAVGVKVFRDRPEGLDGLETFKGASYCEAASRAKRQPVLVRGESLGVCKWSPAVMAFKEAEGGFESKLQPRLRPPVDTVLLAPLDAFPAGHQPEVVILQGPAGTLWKLFKDMDREDWAVEWASEIARSALGLELDGLPQWKIKAVSLINRGLAKLTPHPAWQRFTRVAFRSKAVSHLFEVIFNPFQASMSVCRNSTVIPYLTGKANLSFFCAGGITWGSNPSTHMTCGVPYSLLNPGSAPHR
jgi:hypothetical protein